MAFWGYGLLLLANSKCLLLYKKNTVNNRSCHGTFLFQEHLNAVCAHFIHSSLIFAFSMGKNENDMEQKKEERAQE